MDLIKDFIKYLRDPKPNLSYKALSLLAVFILLLLVNDTVGYTYYQNKKQKLEQLERISNILKDSSLPRAARVEVLSMQGSIIKHKSIIEKLDEWSDLQRKRVEERTALENKKVHRRSPIGQLISGGILGWIVVLLIIFVGVPQAIVNFKRGMATLLVGLPLGFGMAYLMSFFTSFIPVIANHPEINYGLNVLLNFSFGTIATLISDRSKKKKREAEEESERQVSLVN